MGNRGTALALVLLIVAAELLLSGHAQKAWAALWGGPHPLGQESGATGTGGAGGSVNSGGFPLVPGDPGQTGSQPPVFTT